MARSTASDPDQEYVYFMGSETLPSALQLSDESSIPFYSMRNGYNYILTIYAVTGIKRKNAIVEYLDYTDTRYSANGAKGKWRYTSSKARLKCATYRR